MGEQGRHVKGKSHRRDRLSDRLMGATSEEEAGQLLVEDLRASFDACAAWIARALAAGGPSGLVDVASEPAIDLYFSEGHASDPLLRKALAARVSSGSVYSLSLQETKTTAEQEFSAFMRNIGWGHVVEGLMSAGEQVHYVVGVAREPEAMAFTAAEQALLGCKLQDATALQLFHLQEVATALQDAVAHACGENAAVLLLDEAGRPLLARGNLAALRPVDGQLAAADDAIDPVALPPRLLAALKCGVRQHRTGAEDLSTHSELLTLDGLALDLSITQVRNRQLKPCVHYSAILRPCRGDPALGRQNSALHDTLSEREREIVLCAARGMNPNEAAEHLGISPWTVRTHLRNIYEKTGVTSRSALVALFWAGNEAHSVGK